MRAQSAAPGEAVTATPGSSGKDSGNAASIPPTIASRLAAYGIVNLEQWRALGRKRLELFGVTRTMCAQLDALAKVAP